jgi:hypothetical protein
MEMEDSEEENEEVSRRRLAAARIKGKARDADEGRVRVFHAQWVGYHLYGCSDEIPCRLCSDGRMGEACCVFAYTSLGSQIVSDPDE